MVYINAFTKFEGKIQDGGMRVETENFSQNHI